MKSYKDFLCQCKHQQEVKLSEILERRGKQSLNFAGIFL